MRKKGIAYIVIILSTVAVLMLLQYNKPKEVNWFESYVSTHKIPYGTLVFNELMANTLYPNKVTEVALPPFEFLAKDSNLKGTYVFINNTIKFDEAERNSLLAWTAKGNTLFIASEGFGTQLLDTLHIDSRVAYSGFETSQKQNHKLVNPHFNTSQKYSYSKDNTITLFSKLDTTNTTVLATVFLPGKTDDADADIVNITAIKTKFGNGDIILSTFPKAFTNYFILKNNNKDYTAGLSTYLDNDAVIYVDKHHKSGKAFYTSPMYIFLNTKELKWAYYIALIGAVMYIIFEGKRKQRAIPVVKPLQNQTLAFTKTISDMYFEKNDQKAIVEHKINYFLNDIRSNYYIETTDINDDFIKKIASKSGHSLQETTTLFTYIKTLKSTSIISDNEIIKLNELIQKYKRQPNGK